MKTQMQLHVANIRAAKFINLLADTYEKISIAGSIRREKPFVGDIELVVIPKIQVQEIQTGLGKFFDISQEQEVNLLEQRLIELYKAKLFCFGKNGSKYKELLFEDYKIDLFLAYPQNWGLILMIRTGPGSYSKNFMIALNQKGEYKVKDGFLWKIIDAQTLIKQTVETEEKLYSTVGFLYAKPQNRY